MLTQIRGFQARRLVMQATPPTGQAAFACLVVYKREWVSYAAVPGARKTNARNLSPKEQPFTGSRGQRTALGSPYVCPVLFHARKFASRSCKLHPTSVVVSDFEHVRVAERSDAKQEKACMKATESLKQ